MKETKHIEKYKDLIFDVGMHKGEDTDFYLKKGFRVVSFEANPDLVAHCRNRFKEEIENGKLIIIEGAIIESEERDANAKVKFYRNKSISVWGTVSDDWVKINEMTKPSSEIEVIEVPVVNFSKALEVHGIPHYLKIDIEGMDIVCLRALSNFEQKPDYVSKETEMEPFSKVIEEMDLFQSLGYSKFKAIQQRDVIGQKEPNPSKEGRYIDYAFQIHASGLFGEDLQGNWKSYKNILKEHKMISILYKLWGPPGALNNIYGGDYLRRIMQKVLNRRIPGWYDTHAKHSSAS